MDASLHTLQRVRTPLISTLIAVAVMIAATACPTRGAWATLTPAIPGVTGNYVGFEVNDIACSGPTFCIAVGPPWQGIDTAAAWDGTTWRVIPPRPEGSWSPLQCAAPTWCVAFTFGSAGRFVVWNGESWTTGDYPAIASLNQLASCPAVNVCFGYYLNNYTRTEPALFRWDGARWSPISGSEVHSVEDVDCATPDVCTLLVGEPPAGEEQYASTGFVRWENGAWSKLPASNPAVTGGLNVIDCPTATFCAASPWYRTGDYSHPPPFATVSDRAAQVTTLPLPFNLDNVFAELSCASPTSCLAVSRTAGVRFDGTRWTPLPSIPLTALAASSGRMGIPVACPADRTCFLLRKTAREGGRGTFDSIQRWNGSTWSDIGPMVGAGAAQPFASFADVSCATVTWCLAVGTRRYGIRSLLLAEAWDGDRNSWTVLPDLPLADGASVETDPDAVHVACDQPDSCVIAAATESVEGSTKPILARWDGATWTVHDRAGFATIDDVACGGRRWCAAVGTTVPSGAAAAPQSMLAEAWDGSGWRPMTAPSDAGRTAGLIPRSRLTCVSPTFCALASSTWTLTGLHRPVVQFWDGTTWTAAPTFPATDGIVMDISCVATNACITVGLTRAGVTGLALGLGGHSTMTRWNGTGWTTQTWRSPAAARARAISCGDATPHCMAPFGPHPLAPNARSDDAAVTPYGDPNYPPLTSPGPEPTGWSVTAHGASCVADRCLMVGDAVNGAAKRPVAHSLHVRFVPWR